jgi:nucleoredoxin
MSNPGLRRVFYLVLGLSSLATMRGDTQGLAAELNGQLVSVQGKQVQSFNTSSLKEAKYFAFYFSAKHCVPCHQFTPKLVSFYTETKPKHPEFELVLVDEDYSESEMQKYMTEMSMPWPALRYGSIASKHDITKLAGPGIPCLVLVDDKGKVLSDSFKGKEYLGPYHVMKDIEALLNEGKMPVAQTATGVSPAASPASASTNGKPANGTNWDDFFKKKP